MKISVENLEETLERMAQDQKRTANLGNAWNFVVEQSDGAQTLVALVAQDIASGKPLSKALETFAAKMLCIGHEMANVPELVQ